jgi:mRNA-degrading endonuclease YafQ of YafQ-DinJ toxin-antitoxin module
MRTEIGFSSSFKRAFRKRIRRDEKLESQFWESLEKFTENPFDLVLKTPKLSGELEGLWSFSVEYDCRVIFKFREGNRALLIDIGSHDEVY